jgi:transcriptional regulator with XRE-family HTH domain
MKPPVPSFNISCYPSSTFGQYIKKPRLDNGLRQVDVAKAIGVDEITIVTWERCLASRRTID